jgi:hypothetical protein
MTEWRVCCGRNSARWKKATGITHLKLGRDVDDLGKMPKPLLFGLHGLTERSGIGVTAEVLVQRFREDVQVLLLEPDIPFAHKFELGGFGVLENGHLGEATEGGLQ